MLKREGMSYSRIYEGNMSDPVTLQEMIVDLKSQSETISDKVVVIDAGIATEKNLATFQTRS